MKLKNIQKIFRYMYSVSYFPPFLYEFVIYYKYIMNDLGLTYENIYKGRYALRILADIAEHGGRKNVPIH